MMKKLLFALAFLPAAGFSQVLTEDFESGTFPPTGWTTMNANASYNWEEYTNTPITGDASANVQYDPTLGDQDEWLISPSFDLSNLQTAFLEFNTSLSYYWSVSPNNNYDFLVKVSTDGGQIWTTVWTEEQIPEFPDYEPFLVSVNLGQFTGQSNVKVAFQYLGADGAQLVIDDIVVKEEQTPPPTPPINDNCEGAIALTPGNNFAAAAIEATNENATDSTLLPDCQDYALSEVWFTVTVPASGSITIETGAVAGSDNTDTVIDVFTGVCGQLTSIGCNDDNNDSDDLFSKVSLSDLTPGTVLTIGVWQYDGGYEQGAFQIAAYDASLAAPSFDSAKFSYYPNPVKDVLTVEYDNEISNVEVYNLMGQKVLAQELGANAGQINVSTLSSGAYLMKVNAQDAVATYRIVKQ